MSGTLIKNYIMFFKNDNSTNYKKNKKKLSKKYILKRTKFNFIKYHDNSQLLNTLHQTLTTKKNLQECGIIFDSNIILHDITYVPKFPKQYDILCLESEIQSYIKNTETDNSSIYWTPTNIISSGNFIINGSSINKVLSIIEKSTDLTHFFHNLNQLDIFSITQTHLSQRDTHYVHDPLIINKQLNETDILTYQHKITQEYQTKFSNLHLTPDSFHHIDITNHTLLPKISLICPFTNQKTFFHTLLSFLYLDYPPHLLELIIVDDTNSEKKLHLPEDKRIKLININNTEKNPLPLGYKLNSAIKHSSHPLIFHFFDTNNYNLNLRSLIGHFLLSNKECLMTINTGICDKNSNLHIDIPDLANCLYTKNFWKKSSFEDISHHFLTNIDLTFKWISYRTHEISFLPFTNISFKIISPSHTLHTHTHSQDLSTLVDKKIKESFDLLFIT